MGNNSHNHSKEEEIILHGFLSEFRDALREEIHAIEKGGQSSTLLFAGRKIESRGAEFLYQFNVEYAPAIPASTPCKLLIGKEQFVVTVVSFQDNSIIISTKDVLPDTIGNARLENGSPFLMEQLIKYIEQNAEIENVAGKRMLASNGEIYSAQRLFDYSDLRLSGENTQSQNAAIKAALSYDITYIWGPPGTGKTTVIGQIIDELYKHDRSVLVVSHTNTAVDGAIKKADETYCKEKTSGSELYPILRIGECSNFLPSRVELKNHIAVLGKELYEKKEELEKNQETIQKKINEIQPILAKNAWVNENNLEQIRISLQSSSRYEKEIRDAQRKINKINIDMEREKLSHPEHAKYLAVSKIIKEKRDIYDNVCRQAQNAEDKINGLPTQIQNAQDERKKHDIYAELCAEEAKFMSVSFLQKEISKIRVNVMFLNNEISNLEKEQTEKEQLITDYARKSSVAKFFSGKGSIIQAQEDLRKICNRLSQAKEESQRQENLQEEYNAQLKKLMVLQDKIKAVMPSKTREFWDKEIKNLQSEFAVAKEVLSSLNTQKVALYEEIANLEQNQQLAKFSFDVIDELERCLKKEQEYLSKIKANYAQENSRCEELLEKECYLCAAFFEIPKYERKSILFDELSALLVSAKKEISQVDVDVLRREKEELDKQVADIFHQLNELAEKMQALERQAIFSAKIVGTTLTRSYLEEPLRERKFDTVILDEASMASIPALWCASYLAEKSIVIVGDFLQLPPIVMAKTPMAQRWLGKDVFYHSGMQECARNKETCPNNFVMLNDQFRMESEIANIANMYYGEYGGLRSNDLHPVRVNAREEFYKWYAGARTKRCIHLVDTESLHAWVTGIPQGKSHSRLNCFSAAITVDLAFKCLENKLKDFVSKDVEPAKEASVLIIAPYKPHITRINKLIKLEYSNRGFGDKDLNLIRAGTIHSFQGSEADIVIFDLVIDEPHYKAGLFLENKQYEKIDGRETNENLKKLFNVAITRAKFKLYIVGNFAYCQKRAKNNALSELLAKLLEKEKLAKIDVKKLLPNIIFSKQRDFIFDKKLEAKHIVCQEASFSDYFMSDVHFFKKRLIVYSPFMTEARLSLLLPAFVDAINAGKQIIVVTKALSDRGKRELFQYEKCERELREIGVNIIHKKGMHEKLIFVDSEAVWMGSLNALSFTGLTGEIMHRHADKELTAEYEKLFDIEHLSGVIESEHEKKCPICGGEMLIKEGDEGGIYWQCVEGDYSRSTTQPYPLDGILRCKCGAPFLFAMKNEPRWICSENPRHYQKMRKGDLKFEKMVSLIPSKIARKEVEQYFADKEKENNRKKKESENIIVAEQMSLF